MTDFNTITLDKCRHILRKDYNVSNSNLVRLNVTRLSTTIIIQIHHKGSNMHIPFFIDGIFIFILRLKRSTEFGDGAHHIYTTKI